MGSEKAKKIKSGNNRTETYAPILEAIKRSAISGGSIQFHIPGHTKGSGILPDFKVLLSKYDAATLDSTDEFESIGTLHPSTGPIKEAQELAAKAFGAKESFFLLNGSSIGNMALALTLIKPNDKVLIGRNCHRSIVTGMIMSSANPIWITPKKHEKYSIWGEIDPQAVKNELEINPDIKLVWITSPTYEGIVSDIKAISDICKYYNIPLIVDEAHGCLWNFSPKLPTSALHLGASAVVHSMHKTGGSFSQSSILHVAKDSIIDIERLKHNLRLLHTTSPSILLLVSIDAARAYLESDDGKKLIENAIDNAIYVRNELKDYQNVHVLSNNKDFKIDPTKLFISIDGFTGARLETILKTEFNIEIESTTDYGFLALLNIGNNFDEVKYFVQSIKKIAISNYHDISYMEKLKFMPLLTPIIKMTPREAFYMESEKVSLEDSIGRISSQIIAECPPGIFILVPGELITDAHLPYLRKYKEISVLK